MKCTREHAKHSRLAARLAVWLAGCGARRLSAGIEQGIALRSARQTLRAGRLALSSRVRGRSLVCCSWAGCGATRARASSRTEGSASTCASSAGARAAACPTCARPACSAAACTTPAGAPSARATTTTGLCKQKPGCRRKRRRFVQPRLMSGISRIGGQQSGHAACGDQGSSHEDLQCCESVGYPMRHLPRRSGDQLDNINGRLRQACEV